MRIKPHFLILFFLIFTISQCKKNEGNNPDLSFAYQTTKPSEIGFALSPDGTKIAFKMVRGDKELLVIRDAMGNLKEGKEYDWIKGILFSPNGKRVAYTAYRDGKYFLVVDENEGQAHPYINSENTTFSPNGKKVAFLSDSHFIIDGHTDNYFSYGSNRVIFSPDSQNYAYLAGSYKAYFVVKNGKRGEIYKNIIGGPFFRKSDLKLTYVADSNNERFLVVEGVEGKKYKCSQSFSKRELVVTNEECNTIPLHSHEGTIEFSGYNEKGEWVTVNQDGEEKISSDTLKRQNKKLEASSVKHEKDGHITYSVKINNREGKEYDKVDLLTFSSDEKKFAYAACNRQSCFIVLDEKELNPYQQVYHLEFNSKGDLFYIARKGRKTFLVLNDKVLAEYEGIGVFGMPQKNIEKEEVFYKTDKGEFKVFRLKEDSFPSAECHLSINDFIIYTYDCLYSGLDYKKISPNVFIFQASSGYEGCVYGQRVLVATYPPADYFVETIGNCQEMGKIESNNQKITIHFKSGPVGASSIAPAISYIFDYKTKKLQAR